MQSERMKGAAVGAACGRHAHVVQAVGDGARHGARAAQLDICPAVDSGPTKKSFQ
jgi:hypothetical protein